LCVDSLRLSACREHKTFVTFRIELSLPNFEDAIVYAYLTHRHFYAYFEVVQYLCLTYISERGVRAVKKILNIDYFYDAEHFVSPGETVSSKTSTGINPL
jgi:hypothetical protein